MLLCENNCGRRADGIYAELTGVEGSPQATGVGNKKIFCAECAEKKLYPTSTTWKRLHKIEPLKQEVFRA